MKLPTMSRARADKLDHGLTEAEAEAWRRMCHKLRRAGHIKRKRAWEATALRWVYSLRFIAWYNALDPTSSSAISMSGDAIWHARRIEEIEGQGVAPKSERRKRASGPPKPFG